jgi:hypothetical protein
MARKTKLKIAAFATALVATVGFVAVGPATASDSGRTTLQKTAVSHDCC